MTSTLIQSVHRFVRTHKQESSPPFEKTIVFDEAQRAWNEKQMEKKKKGRMSEPEAILSIMDRHSDGAAVIALVGGGQEIHDGEAGLEEWGRALSEKFPHWRIVASPEALTGGESVAANVLFKQQISNGLRIEIAPKLHLAVSVRSFRAEKLAQWVNQVLVGDSKGAANTAQQIGGFPIVLTRDLSSARAWLRSVGKGSRRFGLVASSRAVRLRADGIETSTGFHRSYPYRHWFLSGPEDYRSSFQLEVAATEFEIQGLELDWVGLCWGGDLLWDCEASAWRARYVRNASWCLEKSAIKRTYTLNSYRVLLTRARQGLVIWVPRGDPGDSTRRPQPFDDTFNFLQRCGARPLE